jgi:hypothetical protein
LSEALNPCKNLKRKIKTLFMKRISTICLILIFVAASAVAQRRNALQNHKNIPRVGINSEFSDEEGLPLMVGWEFKTNKRQSILVSVAPRYYRSEDYKRTGIGIGAEYRFYLSKNKTGISGVYFGPAAAFGRLNIDDMYSYYNGTTFVTTRTSYKYTHFNIGAAFGHQWVWQSGFALDLGLGASFRISDDDSQRPYYYSSFGREEGFIPRANVTIGYAF